MWDLGFGIWDLGFGLWECEIEIDHLDCAEDKDVHTKDTKAFTKEMTKKFRALGNADCDIGFPNA